MGYWGETADDSQVQRSEIHPAAAPILTDKCITSCSLDLYEWWALKWRLPGIAVWKQQLDKLGNVLIRFLADGEVRRLTDTMNGVKLFKWSRGMISLAQLSVRTGGKWKQPVTGMKTPLAVYTRSHYHTFYWARLAVSSLHTGLTGFWLKELDCSEASDSELQTKKHTKT